MSPLFLFRHFSKGIEVFLKPQITSKDKTIEKAAHRAECIALDFSETSELHAMRHALCSLRYSFEL